MLLYRGRLKKGFSMIELIIGIAVIGVLTAVVLNQSQKMRESSNLSRESSNLALLTTAIQSTFNSQGNYSGLSNEVIKRTNAFPAAMDGSDNNIDSVWGSGDVAVYPVNYSGATNAAFSIVYDFVPSTSCVDFVSNNYSTFYKVSIGVTGGAEGTGATGGTVVWDREPDSSTHTDFNIATMINQCGDAGETVAVEFRSR